MVDLIRRYLILSLFVITGPGAVDLERHVTAHNLVYPNHHLPKSLEKKYGLITKVINDGFETLRDQSTEESDTTTSTTPLTTTAATQDQVTQQTQVQIQGNVMSSNNTTSNGMLTSMLDLGTVTVPLFSALLFVGFFVLLAAQLRNQDKMQRQEIAQQIDQMLISGSFFGATVPVNDLPIPVSGMDFQNDGCGDGSVKFNNGVCYPVLKRGPCHRNNTWVTVDPLSLKGRCTQRLCGRGRVFVGFDGLCHDVYDPVTCKGGRRLYYSAYGDPVCDCPIGQYPFPAAGDNCVPLFQPGLCCGRNAVNLDHRDKLVCDKKTCPPMGIPVNQKVSAIIKNNTCAELNDQCLATSRIMGYDVFKRLLVCVDINDESSPYFNSSEEDDPLAQVYNQPSPEYGEYQTVFVYRNQFRENMKTASNDRLEQKQDLSTFGIFRVPSAFPDTLLNPCRPGARRGLNYKCTNPLLMENVGKSFLPAVAPAFRCPLETFLQATTFCTASYLSSSCGPSYRYNEATGQCRSIFMQETMT